MRKNFLLLLALLTTLYLTISCSYSENSDRVIYTMINVCDSVQQGDAHLLIFNNGVTYAIDAGGGNPGTRKKLSHYLLKNKIKHIDKFFITHAHKDHYEGIVDAIESGVRIGEIFFNIPDKEACDREKPWGCDYNDITTTIEFIKGHNIPVKSLRMGDVFLPQNNTALLVLAAYDGYNTPIGQTDINDTSVIMKLVHGNTSILFSGDLNVKVGEFLVTYSYNLKSDILKVPHHGAELAATNAFFDMVSPKLAFVPAPENLWLSERSKRIRDYFTDKKIPVMISGINNDVTVILSKNNFEVVK